MFNKLIKLNLAIFTLFFIFATQNIYANTETQENSSPLEITDISIQPVDNGTEIKILANKSIDAYQDNIIAGTDTAPARMYIDIADATLGNIKREYAVGSYLDKIRIALNDNGARIVFDSAGSDLFEYSISAFPDGIKILITALSTPEKTAKSQDTTLDELIDSSVSQLEKQSVTVPATEIAPPVENNFRVSGFKKELISVDFYKIDLHNVFRLFREVSGMNIIVDEKVSGTLTLSLNNVPWDFALDIILNLSDLQKEERFNTLVIYPADSSFTWPERTSIDNLDIETDNQILEQETLIVQQSANQPKEIMQAQQILQNAKKAEQQKDFEVAAKLYEEALALWPDNEKISIRLSTLYLVELGMNAKAVYYATNVLEEDPQNYRAALYAAIGSANMHKNTEAMEFFNQSISGNPPMKEALISYAAFVEQNNLYDESLKLLAKHDQFFGESLNTMLSKARIYDKQGDSDNATKQYGSLLNSGYQLTPDLKKYIRDRIAAGDIH